MLLPGSRRRSLSAAWLALVLLACGCDQFKALTSVDESGPPVPPALFPLHQALEEHASESKKATVAVLVVVDQSRFAAAPTAKAPPDEGPGDAPPAANPAPVEDPEALRLERLVRQELNNGFVRNRKLEVIQPDETSVTLARADVLRGNSAALDSTLATQLGTQLKAAYVICAVIEEGGSAVNVACQRSADGKLVFQDSVKNWSIFAAPEEPAAGG